MYNHYLAIVYSYSVKHKYTPQMSLVHETRRPTVETISKQLEYVTRFEKSHLPRTIINL